MCTASWSCIERLRSRCVRTHTVDREMLCVTHEVSYGYTSVTAHTAPSGTGTAPAVATSADAVMKLVQDQLTQERAAKASLETRAIGVIASSGALATLFSR